MTYKAKVQNYLQAKIDRYRHWEEEENALADRLYRKSPEHAEDIAYHREQANANAAAADTLQIVLNELLEL